MIVDLDIEDLELIEEALENTITLCDLMAGRKHYTDATRISWDNEKLDLVKLVEKVQRRLSEPYEGLIH